MTMFSLSSGFSAAGSAISTCRRPSLRPAAGTSGLVSSNVSSGPGPMPGSAAHPEISTASPRTIPCVRNLIIPYLSILLSRSTPCPPVIAAHVALASAQNALRIALEIRNRLFDAGNGPARITDQRLDESEEHTSELQSRENLVCRLLLEKKKTYK